MIDIYMRYVKDVALIPFLNLLKYYKFSPNYLTLLSGVFGLIGLYYVT